MHLAFVDFVYHYDAARPEKDEPLGGTTSAICFLATELVKKGIFCTLFNRATVPSEAHGVKTMPLQMLGGVLENDIFDAYIFCGRWTTELVELVAKHSTKPLIAWMHESAFMKPMTPALDAFNGVVFVSEWQKRVNQGFVKMHWKQGVIRNAMNPIISNSFSQEKNILDVKKAPPVLLYAGSFARGAFHIPPLLDKIRAHRQDFTVELYCNLDPSRDPIKDEAYVSWVRSQPNITHMGMVGQAKLARRMQEAFILLMPNPWPETSCITLIEGLASGMVAVTTNRAALPETASGFSRQVPIDMPDEQVRFDMLFNSDLFVKEVLEVFQMRDNFSAELEINLRQQVDYFHANYQWSQRVAPWLAFITSLQSN